MRRPRPREGRAWPRAKERGSSRASLPATTTLHPRTIPPQPRHSPTLSPAPPVWSGDEKGIRVYLQRVTFNVTRVSKHIRNGFSKDSKGDAQQGTHRADLRGNVSKPWHVGSLAGARGLVLKLSSGARMLCELQQVAS